MDLQNKEDDLPHHMPPLGPPTLFQSALDFGRVPQGRHKTLQQVIANTNKHPVIWLAESGEAGWLTLDPDRGVLQPGEQQSIRVTANTASLAVGEHSVTLTFSLEGDETSMSKDIATKMIVDETPKQPTPLGVSVNFGELRPHSTRILELVISNPDDREVTWNVGIGSGVQMTLEHLRDSNGKEIPAGIPTPIELSDQLSLSQKSVTLKPRESKIIRVTARADGLKSGHSYSTTLTCMKDGDTSSPVQIPVLYHVNASKCPLYDGGPKPPCDLPANISISQKQVAAPMDFTNPQENAEEHPEQKAVNGQVDWKLVSDSDWLTTEPSSGSFVAGEKAGVKVKTERVVHGQTAHLTLKLNFAKNPATRPETDVTIPVTIVA